MFRRFVTVLSVLACSLAAAGHALAADPGAPPGAGPNWLPNVPWVMHRWMPFDQHELYVDLSMPDAAVYDWLKTNKRSLAQLARRRGFNPHRLSTKLVAAWWAPSDLPTSAAMRLSRAWLLFRHPHLAAHMLFHNFHNSVIPNEAPRLFGVPSTSRWDLMFACMHWSPVEIGHYYGVPTALVRARTLRALAGSARQGVRIGAMPPDEASYEIAAQHETIGRQFLNYHLYGMPMEPGTDCR